MTINASAITSVIVEQFPQAFESAVTRRSQLFNLFRKLPPTSAQGPRWQVKSAGHSGVSSFSEGAVAPAPDEFDRVQASLSWGQYHGTLKLTGLSRDELDLAGDLFIDNYLAEQFMDIADEIVDTVESDLRGSGGSPGLVGLATICDDGGTYAGIARSGNTYWQSYTSDNSGTPRALTMTLMNTVHNNLVDTIGGDYDAILTSKTQFDAYCGLTSGTGAPATNQMHIMPSERQLSAVGGFGDIAWFNGRPIIPIKGYTSGRMDFVTLDELVIRVLKGVSVKEVQTSNDDQEWYITWKGQTEYRNPRFRAASLQDLS